MCRQKMCSQRKFSGIQRTLKLDINNEKIKTFKGSLLLKDWFQFLRTFIKSSHKLTFEFSILVLHFSKLNLNPPNEIQSENGNQKYNLEEHANAVRREDLSKELKNEYQF